MKVVFSEFVPDFQRYIFPYHVWGFLEEGESVRAAYSRGFLPVAYDMSRFYLVRSIRVVLPRYTPHGRVRYVQRKCQHIAHELVDRDSFELTSAASDMTDRYFATQQVNADYRRNRFHEMLASPFTTHVLRLWERESGRPAGLVPLFLRDGIAHYGIPVYDPVDRTTSIGNHMMAAALGLLADAGHDHCYLGSCYKTGDLYKTRFAGMQFFNGYTWSEDRDELHYLVRRRDEPVHDHVLSSGEYLDRFCDSDIQSLAKKTDMAFGLA
jgi:hypothetical protein